MNSLTSETASTLSLMDDMEELDWYFQDIFDQFGNVYCLFNNINCLLDDCPLEFLLFEVQQLISLYDDTEMLPIHVYEQRSFAPFSTAYSSETLAPLVRKNRQISHVQYLL